MLSLYFKIFDGIFSSDFVIKKIILIKATIINIEINIINCFFHTFIYSL